MPEFEQAAYFRRGREDKEDTEIRLGHELPDSYKKKLSKCLCKCGLKKQT